jgi:hypothetical protein
VFVVGAGKKRGRVEVDLIPVDICVIEVVDGDFKNDGDLRVWEC